MVALAGVSVTEPPFADHCLTVASPPGMPATTMSPFGRGGLLGDDDEVAVEDAGVDHRVAAHAEHEELALAGEVGGDREQLLDVLLGEHVGAGGDVADQRDVADRPPLHRRAGVRVPAHLDRPRLRRVPAQEAEALQRVQVAVHRRW